MPTWATWARESAISPVNITSAGKGVEGHDGSDTSRGGHRRHVRTGGRAAQGAHHRGLLGHVVWAVPYGGADPGAARGRVPGETEGGQDGRGREPEDADAL